ncbi:unnamed protein product, partial [Ixodes hexagonus]
RYKVWHYTGSLQHEVLCKENEELWDVQWQPFPPEAFPAKPVSYKQVSGIQSSQPQASKQVYRPPCARGQGPSFKVKDDEPPAGGDKPGNAAAKPKCALKNQKRREAKKAKRENEQASQLSLGGDSPEKAPVAVQRVTETSAQNTEEVSKEKKIKNLKKKLDQIAILKEQVQSGKTLEANQVCQ